MVALIRRTPRVLFASAVVAVVLLILAAARWNGQVMATSDADPYSVPVVTDTNPDPNIVETTITAAGAVVDIGNGLMASVLAFNGTIPGPEFRLKVGDTVIVHFKNELGHASGIHWHGIELANASDGTPLTQNMVPTGETFLYKFTVSRPGVYWYHPHHHSSTNQVFKGLYGSIIVEDPNEAALIASGVLPSAAQTKTLVLSDITVCKAVNDASTFDPLTQPWLDGTQGALPPQAGPPRSKPLGLCQTDPIDEDGAPRGPYAPGDVPNIQPSGNSGTVVEGQTVLTNGVNPGGRAGFPAAPGGLSADAYTMDVQAGQGLRLQLVNTATTRFFRLRLTDEVGTLIPIVHIGGQGGLLNDAVTEGSVHGNPAIFDAGYDIGEVLLDPGDRLDVVVAIPATAVGPLTLWTKDFGRTGPSGNFSNIPTVPVAHFTVVGAVSPAYTTPTALRSATGDPQIVLGPATGTLLDPAAFAAPKPGMPLQDITLTNSSPAPSTVGINAIMGAHDPGEPYSSAARKDSTRYAVLGDTLELTVTNITGAHHPFHLHGFSIQPIELTKAGSPTYTYPPDYRDNVNVPNGYSLRFRVKLEDRALMDGATMGGGVGRWVFHCHIFFHATFGMISEFDVVAADGNERPFINANGTLLEGNASDPLTMHGTFGDPDGDAVTLTASVGAIVDDGGGNWTWTGTVASSRLVYVTASDGTRRDQAVFEVKINAPPVVTVSNAAGDEGSAIAIHGTAVDPESDPLTHTWTYAAVSGVDAGATCSFASASSLDTTVTCTDDGTYSITLTVNDGHNAPVVKSGTLTVANVPPTIVVTSPATGALYIVGTTVPVIASITDPGTNDTYTAATCTFNWDGGGATTVGAPVGTTCTRSNLFTAAGVYTVTVSGADDDGGTGSATVMIVIYDPSAGFVTGGGTIDSPAGAYRPDLSIAGRANFGFFSKYQKGANVPTGQTEFNFQAADFNFHASVYDWLVVAPAKAQYKGTGQINGSGVYRFLLTMIDGQAQGGGGIDKFRLKVWHEATNTVIYDNKFGAPEDIDVADPQALASGSIVIHTGKK